jgi:hypothetical protein
VAAAARRIRIEERRARLGLRHHLAAQAQASSVVEVAQGLVGLHATDPASVYLAAIVRMRTGEPSIIERALYDERSVIRMLGMRRTMFVVPVELAPVVHAACTRKIAMQERRRLVHHLDQARVAADPGTWLKDVEESTLRVLEARGEATAVELSDEEPRLRTSLLMAEGKPYQAQPNICTRVLFLLAADGRIIRGRPRGSWTSSQYRWSPLQTWLPGGLPHLPTEAAQLELARRWLAAFGPGTVADLQWWSGWTAGDTRRALAQLDVAEVDLNGTNGLVLADDLEPITANAPWAALLPALDPTAMAWSDRGWFLGGHAPALFDRSGNIGPTVWWDGRVVGGWAQRREGDIVFRLLEDIGHDAVAALVAAAELLSHRMGTVRVTPRFRTPLEQELTA